MLERLFDFLYGNWQLLLIFTSIISPIVTPVVVAIINRRTIRFSSADDLIKLNEYRENKKEEKKKNNFYRKLYNKCFQNQKKYKGWILWDFQEFGDIENRWFRVRNKEGEYLTIRFPEKYIVRRYGFSLNDRLDQGRYMYKPNFVENIFYNIKYKNSKEIINKYISNLITFLEEKKQKNETVEILDILKKFKNIDLNILENMLVIIRDEKQRNDLTDLIIIRQVGTNQVSPYFKK